MSHVRYSYTHHTTPSTSHTGGALNLPAVLAGAVVAFLLLTLLIAGIIVGVVLLGRAKRRRKKSNEKSKMVKVGCEEKQEVSPENESTAGNDSERRISQAAFHYEQHAEDMHYEKLTLGDRVGEVEKKAMESGLRKAIMTL